MRLLIDGDIVAFQAAVTNEKSIDWVGDGDVVKMLDKEAAYRKAKEFITKLQVRFKTDDVLLCFSCSRDKNWRRDYLPSYKAHRPSDPPALLNDVKDFLKTKYQSIENSRLEADDLLAMQQSDESIVCSGDKDMLTIPGKVYLWNRDKIYNNTLRDANRYHYSQALTGDSADGYKGCPLVGPKKAETFLEEFDDIICEDEYKSKVWEGIVKLFENKKLTEEDAKVQFYVSRLLRRGEYNFKEKTVEIKL